MKIAFRQQEVDSIIDVVGMIPENKDNPRIIMTAGIATIRIPKTPINISNVKGMPNIQVKAYEIINRLMTKYDTPMYDLMFDTDIITLKEFQILCKYYLVDYIRII